MEIEQINKNSKNIQIQHNKKQAKSTIIWKQSKETKPARINKYNTIQEQPKSAILWKQNK